MDLEVLALAKLLGKEQERRPREDRWGGSPFAWLAPWPPAKTKGEIFESVVHRWCEEMGLTVARTGDSEADRVIGGRRFEIKGSTLWKNGKYVFQQIRKQNYDALVCLGISPFDAHCWIIPKGVVLEQWGAGGIRPQHGGRRGQDTAWLKIRPSRPDKWLRDCGGSLSEAKQCLRSFLSATSG
ncbi:MAG: hypothetical protein F4Z74_02155 [Acidobacteria bacterium]|nr:hypothetical protein [Acidobacteriota bacterium]MYE42684.1 hypothetical protein [Acidobacteriota bacterium]